MHATFHDVEKVMSQKMTLQIGETYAREDHSTSNECLRKKYNPMVECPVTAYYMTQLAHQKLSTDQMAMLSSSHSMSQLLHLLTTIENLQYHGSTSRLRP